MNNKHQWDHQNFTNLKGRTGNVTLKISFTEFVEVSDGN